MTVASENTEGDYRAPYFGDPCHTGTDEHLSSIGNLQQLYAICYILMTHLFWAVLYTWMIGRTPNIRLEGTMAKDTQTFKRRIQIAPTFQFLRVASDIVVSVPERRDS